MTDKDRTQAPSKLKALRPTNAQPGPYNAVVLALVEALLSLDQGNVRGMVRHPMDRPTL